MRLLIQLISALTIVVGAGCGADKGPMSPVPPAPLPGSPIANVYILPGAVDLGPNAFGDHPVLIFRGEQMRWRNADIVEHNLVADTASLPGFTTTGTLAPGSERTFRMNTAGATNIHCTIHPQMVGRLVVQER